LNKLIAIPVMAVLGVVVIGVLAFAVIQTQALANSRTEVEGLAQDVNTLQTNLDETHAVLTTTQTQLADTETSLTSANSQITKLEADVSAQQTLNQTLATDLKTVQDPRHFSSLSELVDWLDADDTDTAYADADIDERAFILQVRALRDGYLLPAVIYWDEVNNDGNYYYNIAVIGDKVYGVLSGYDDTWTDTYTDPIPSHPLPLN